MKRLVFLLLAFACIMGVLCAFSVPASAAEEFVEIEEVTEAMLYNVATGEYLNFDNGILKNGTYVRVYPFDGTAEQRWKIVKVEENEYRIITHKSSKYCLDIYRGSGALRSGLLADIWEAGKDAYAQNVIFYRCDNGNYVIRMAEDPQLAIAATKSKGRVKLVKFDPKSKYQQWEIKDFDGNKLDPAKEPADQLSKPEELTFVKPLVSKWTTNVTTQKWGAKYTNNKYHLGVDLGTSGNKSTTVMAIADGVVWRVVKAERSGGWGDLVIVEHTTPDGKTFYSGYGHLKSISVKVGENVKAGDKLAMMGSTGNSTGPHLHLLVFTGSLGKNAVPLGYTSSKISGKSFKANGITYYDPLEVIATKGEIIK